jgi:hypothetical protein
MKVARLSVALCVSIFCACESGLSTTVDSISTAQQPVDITPTAFRVSSLILRDPHPFAGAFFLCVDATDQVNEQIATKLQSDEDGDGDLDLGFAVVFRPLDQGADSTPIEAHVAHCTAPANGTTCSPGSISKTGDATNQAEGVCLAPVPGTVDYAPAPAEPEGPCFVSSEQTLEFELAGIPLTLQGAQIAATYDGNPATTVSNGLIKGFLDEKQAESITIPESVPFVGGKKLAALLPGGKGNCSGDDARDVGPDGKTKGWWMYLDFEGSLAGWSDTTEL